jgi:hypothetical protein
MAEKSEVLQGTLDLMILKTLHALGPQNGFGIARRIEQVSEDVLKLNEGTVYTSLLRLLDRDEMGCFGEQPRSQVLLNNQIWSQATRDRDRELGADIRRHCPCA